MCPIVLCYWWEGYYFFTVKDFRLIKMLDMTENYSVRDEVKELALLYRISQMLEEDYDIRNGIDNILINVAKHIGATHCTLTLLNNQTGEITVNASYGLSSKQKKMGRYLSGEGITGQVVANGKPIIVPKISEEPEFLNRTGIKEQFGVQETSFICVPIKDNQEVLGALSVDHPFISGYELKEDVRLLSIVASMVSRSVRLRMQFEIDKERLQEENERLQNELHQKFKLENFVGNSQAMQNVYDSIRQVTQSNTTVLIRGESGSGKELAAHAIHHNSQRANKPYIKVNCAALPETVLEAELFGHEKGAFTGAITSRKGRFELANGGTLFLDEIGDFSPVAQVKLLRVLQEKEFEPVGSNRTVKVDVRIIAATSRDLEKMVETGEFRQDLYYRLNVFPVNMPPLRDRKSDVLLLADHFAQKYAQENSKHIERISTGAIDMLVAYHWPGNVRELENCIERAVLLSNDGVIHGHHLPPSLQMPTNKSNNPQANTLAYDNQGVTGSTTAAPGCNDSNLQLALDNLERELIIEALKRCRGNCSLAAKELGITERIMGLRLKKYTINWKQFRS